MTIRVLLVDDHQIFREALRSLLDKVPELEVVGEAEDGLGLLEIVRDLSPDVICMDIGMPGMNGIDATRQLKAAFPEIKVIALSSHADHVYLVDMLQAGASAYITKARGGKELLNAIEAVTHNRQYLCPSITDVLTRALFLQKSSGQAPRLGPRERQVIRMVAMGMTSHAIANQLGISPSTVEVHRRNIMRKLDLHSAVELTRYAISTGLISD
jgi:DNA-binding NarL/FixJ family response regulator